MEKVDVRGVITSWFIMLKEDKYVLIRIESLVALVTVMFLVMFILDIFRCRSRSSTITAIMTIVDAVSDQIVVYLIGAMQSADFDNPLFPVWATVLVSLRANLGYLSGYSIIDRERRITEVTTVIQFMAAGVLNGSSDLEFAKPLWSLWAILTFRSMHKFVAHGNAIKSLWHGRSSEFLPEYLHVERTEHQDQSNVEDFKKMYPVYGEGNQNIELRKPGYNLHLYVTDQDSLITLYKIHESSKPLLKSSNSCRYKDMSLAFALSKLLRCRLEDVPLHTEIVTMTRKLIILDIIGHEQAKPDAALRILELELAFVRDYFYTLYPMVFSKGLLSLSLNLILSIATFAIALWLAVGIRKVYKPETGTLMLQVNGCNVDVVMTWVFMFFLMFKEVWEMVTYLLSNWARLLLVCKYVQNKRWRIANTGLMEGLMSSFFASKLCDPWHGHIDQYEFLHSCTYNPKFWKLAHTITLGKTPKKFDGRKAGDAIKIPESVKAAVLQKLGDRVQAEIPSLKYSRNRFQRYERASIRLHTCSQVIMVWHIATSLCEIKLAEDKNIDSGKSGFLNSVWTRLKKMGCRSSDPFLLDEKTRGAGELQKNYQISNSLSRYCAYLLVFRPSLLPDSFTVPEAMFESTLKHAHARMKIKDWMMQEALQDSEDGDLNVMQQGVKLAKDLIDNEGQEKRWEILAEVWADLLVDIAPSWNAEAHKDSLESGGEFITLIWALLWHCGIEKSSLSQEDSANGTESCAEPETNTSRARRVEPAQRKSESNNSTPQEDSTEIINRSQCAEEQADEDGTARQDELGTNNFRTDTGGRAHWESEAKNVAPQQNSSDANTTSVEEHDNEDEIEIAEEPEITNFRRESGSRNAPIDTEEQAQTSSSTG